MSFEWIELSIIGFIAIIVVVYSALYTVKKQSKIVNKKSYQFIIMGIIWLISGLVYSIFREANLFDIGMFNLGIIFTLSGTIGIIIDYIKKE